MGAGKKKWLLTGGLGTSLVGLGLCAVIEAGFLKHGGMSWMIWVPLGTLSLLVFMFGLVLLIKAGKYE